MSFIKGIDTAQVLCELTLALHIVCMLDQMTMTKSIKLKRKGADFLKCSMFLFGEYIIAKCVIGMKALQTIVLIDMVVV